MFATQVLTTESTQMKRFISMLAAVAILTPGLALADGHYGSTSPSEMSALGGLSMVYGSLLVVSSPFLVVSNVVEASGKSGKVSVEVTTETGAKETIALPRETVVKAQLAAGDKLTVKPSKAGGLVSKNGVPIAYVVTPENAKLTRSHELAR